MRNNIINNTLIICAFFILASCSGGYSSEQEVNSQINIYPDYSSVVVPRTIAPLNFTVQDSADYYLFEFIDSSNKSLFTLKNGSGDSDIPIKKWKQALSNASNSFIVIKIAVIKGGVRYNYPVFKINISDDAIDTHLVYRLTNPGMYGANMGIYQRDLSSFNESPIIENDPDSRGCMNCHTFLNNSPESFMFHMRQEYDGTVITVDGKSEKFDLKTGDMMTGAVYPSWHPGGRYIAFSVNQTRQSLHNSGDKIIEVFDLNSDIVIYDIKENKMFSSELIYDKSMVESFPSWSKDGKYLYFVSTNYMATRDLDPIDLKYNLYRVRFDAQTAQFSDYELMFDAQAIDKSVTVPRTYHNDTKVSLSLSDYGNFFVWHNNSDLYSFDIESGQITALVVLNSDKSDSYRCFSTNENWVVFTSRRDDGLFTRLYIAHYDKESGTFAKPFMLPQEKSIHNKINERSYNLPEFITGAVNPEVITSTIKAEPKPIYKGDGL
ncbi:MAG: cytochrome C biosynthesis protein [Rikenellaceae bacterium]